MNKEYSLGSMNGAAARFMIFFLAFKAVNNFVLELFASVCYQLSILSQQKFAFPAYLRSVHTFYIQ